MSKLKLGLDSKKVFGEYLPSVFINKITLSKGTKSDGTADSTAMTNIQASLEISFDKPPNADTSTATWVYQHLDNLVLYAWLCPYAELNTKLEESKLSLHQLYYALQVPPAGPESITSSWPGFTYIINMLKEAFINDWYGSHLTEGFDESGAPWTDITRGEDLEDMDTEVARRFWGPIDESFLAGRLNLDGPWNTPAADSFVYKYLEETLNFVTPASSEEDAYGRRLHAIRLSELATGANGAIFFEQGTYDQKGNEISRIINITLSFEYSPDFFSAIGEGSTSPGIDVTEKLFLICTVGPDVSLVSDLNEPLFNGNFGDISYEHLLEYNVVPNRETTIFVEIENEEIFNGQPIQTINKKYYVPTPMNQKSVSDSLHNLITNFRKWAEKDARLATHIQKFRISLSNKGHRGRSSPGTGTIRRLIPQ